MHLFRIFRVVLLFNYQASLKRFRLFLTDSFLRQRDIYYHAFWKLSTLFFKFFYFSTNSRFPTVLQKRSPVGNQNSSASSTAFKRKKTQYDVTHCVTEKEGFEPSRRANDLHPQQGRLFSHLSTSPYDNKCRTKNSITSLQTIVNLFFIFSIYLYIVLLSGIIFQKQWLYSHSTVFFRSCFI